MSRDNVVRMPRREFSAARLTMLTSDWPIYSRPIDWDLRYGLKALRQRCRHEAQNNDHVKSYLRLLKTNVLGDQGVGLQSRAMLRSGTRPARRERQALERSWREWGRLGACDVTGTLSWCDVQTLMLETCARDGEALLRIVEPWDNAHGIAVQVIDPEQLDIDYTEQLAGGGAVVMGVEIDSWRRPVAYYLQPDGLINYTGYARRGDRIRIKARDIVHVYMPEWVHQTRGVPSMHTALKNLHHGNGYREAAVVAARLGAAAMGHYKQDPEAEPLTGAAGNVQGGTLGDGVTQHGELLREFEPGAIPTLPPGYSFEGWKAEFPNVNHWPFMQALLRDFAAGVGVGYNDLAGDYEGVNFTSLRAAALRDRDIYKAVQRWFIEHALQPVFSRWLPAALGNGAVAVPVPDARTLSQRVDQLGAIRWQPRRWDWVDPLKDIQAAERAVNLRVRSISSYIRERGDDPDEVWDELAEDMRRLGELGLTPAEALAMAAPTAAPEENENA